MVAWLDRQESDQIWTSSITIFEIRLGLNLLSAGRRRTSLHAFFDRMVRTHMGNRIAAFDATAASAAATLAARRRLDGRTVALAGTQIAGIALANRATLATRNTQDFFDLETPVVDPWQSPS